MIGYIIFAILLVAGIGAIVGSALILGKYEDVDVNSQSECLSDKENKKFCKGDTNCCMIWDNGDCRKGKVKGFECVAKGSPIPAILMFSGIAMIIASIVLLIVTIVKQRKHRQ